MRVRPFVGPRGRAGAGRATAGARARGSGRAREAARGRAARAAGRRAAGRGEGARRAPGTPGAGGRRASAGGWGPRGGALARARALEGEDGEGGRALAAWDAFVRFTRPHTMAGTFLSVLSTSLVALDGLAAAGAGAAAGLCQALVAALLMNVAIVGLNQVRTALPPSLPGAVATWNNMAVKK